MPELCTVIQKQMSNFYSVRAEPSLLELCRTEKKVKRSLTFKDRRQSYEEDYDYGNDDGHDYLGQSYEL